MKRQAVDRLHDLPGPAELEPLHLREALARPLLRAGESLVARRSAWPVLWSSPPTINTSCRRAVLKPHVVVRIGRVPQQDRRNAAPGHAAPTTKVRYAACFVWIATRSLTGVLVATTTALRRITPRVSTRAFLPPLIRHVCAVVNRARLAFAAAATPFRYLRM